MQHIITKYLKENALVFDIGANIGEKSQWFVDQGCRVVCVEPQPMMLLALKERFLNNQLVNIVGVAISDYDGETEMLICSNAPKISTISEQWTKGRFASQFEWDQKATVEVTTIDNLVKKFGVPDYCKIDIEGGELPAVKGLSKKLGYLSIEFTSEFIQDAVGCVQHLISIGYAKFNFSIGESPNFAVEHFVENGEEFCNFLLRTAISSPGIWGDIYVAG